MSKVIVLCRFLGPPPTHPKFEKKVSVNQLIKIISGLTGNKILTILCKKRIVSLNLYALIGACVLSMG